MYREQNTFTLQKFTVKPTKAQLNDSNANRLSIAVFIRELKKHKTFLMVVKK